VTDDTVVFEQALAEGDALLAAGAVSHNYYLFRRDAIDACLERGLWQMAADHAAALDAYASREPSPFTAFVVARARALVACGNGSGDAALLGELQRLQADGLSHGYLHALPAIEVAIEAVKARAAH
jgi:hypothetical protein